MNELPFYILFGLLALLLLISAFFTGSETALLTLNRYRLHHLVKKKHRGAIRAQQLLKKPDYLSALIRLGNTLVNILATVLTTLIAVRIGGASAILPAIILLGLAIMIFSETMPKTLAKARPEFIAFLSAWIYLPLFRILYPLLWLVTGFSDLLMKSLVFLATPSKFKLTSARPYPPKTTQQVVNRQAMPLSSLLELESIRIDEIMTPRKEILGIDLDDSLEEIAEQLQNSPHTRLPVYKKTIDNVIGFLHIRTAITRLHTPGFSRQSIIDALSKPHFLPNTTSIQTQMQLFRQEKLRISLVVDEYGDVQGLVTLDDLLQAFVGELLTDQPSVVEQADGSYLIDAGISVRALNRITRTELPTEGPKTLNGLIVEHLESLPQPGTSIKLYGHILEILHCDEHTVKQVKFEIEAAS